MNGHRLTAFINIAVHGQHPAVFGQIDLPAGLPTLHDRGKQNITAEFGRSDFKEVNEHVLSEAVRYIMKYLEKDGGKIVYLRGLPQYFISDIMDEDVACTIGQEDKKLLLFDNFNCWDEGCLVGQVSKEVIDQMPKAN